MITLMASSFTGKNLILIRNDKLPREWDSFQHGLATIFIPGTEIYFGAAFGGNTRKQIIL